MKKFLIITSIICILIIGAVAFLISVATKLALFEVFLTLTPTSSLLSSTNVLILGVDNAFGHRSDTIMVLHSDPGNKNATLMSIPRDTLAVLPGRGLDKINHAYAYGGVELIRKTVENLLDIDIPYYISVNLSGITDLIDELGGITINVEKRMYYADYAGGLFIDLHPGVQRLNGNQLMGYLRYRSDGGDFKRIERQQKFLKALGDEILQHHNVLRSPKLLLTLLSYLETNLNSKETLGLALSLKAAQESSQIKMAYLPGIDMLLDGIYYWKVDEKQVKNIVREYFYGEKNISRLKKG
jgi:LCP family protein required for cell wall assembly